MDRIAWPTLREHCEVVVITVRACTRTANYVRTATETEQPIIAVSVHPKLGGYGRHFSSLS
jgi:hypothetical protein